MRFLRSRMTGDLPDEAQGSPQGETEMTRYLVCLEGRRWQVLMRILVCPDQELPIYRGHPFAGLPAAGHHSTPCGT